MDGESLGEELRKSLTVAQRNEITEHYVYKKLARSSKEPRTREILESISNDELKHYNLWTKYSNQDVKPSVFRVWFYVFISRLFGITFGLKLMEKGEENAQQSYRKLSEAIPEAADITRDEEEHESQLIGLISEERLIYASSMVLGLNDALVELTGALVYFKYSPKSEITELKELLLSRESVLTRVYRQENRFLAHLLRHVKRFYRRLTGKKQTWTR